MAQQKNNVQIVFTSDATQVTKDLRVMGESSEQFSTKLVAVAESAKSLNNYIDGAAGGFVDYGSKSNKYLTSLSNQLANASLSAKELAVQAAKMNAMKFGGSSADVAKAGELAAKIYDVKNASTQAATESDKLGAAIARVGHYGAAAFAFINVSDIVGKVVNVTAEFQRLEASLVTVEGSTSKASASFDLIKTFAQKTPYQLTEVTDAFIKMKAMGLDASLESMQAYGDTASAMSKPLMQMIEAVADAATGEFERLKEFGIKASSEGDKVKFTFKGVTTEVGKNAKEIEQYLIGLGQANFAGGMERQMQTIGGQLSNLQDNWANTFNTIGTASMPAITMAINGLNNASDAVRFMAENTDELAQIAVPMLAVGLTAKAVPTIWATSTALNAAMASAGGFTAAMIAAGRASMAFMATPLGATLAAAGAAALYLSTKTDETAIAVAKLTEKSKELNVELSSKEAERQAKELIKLQQELQGLMARKQSGAVDVMGAKEAELRQRIADVQNLSQKTAELKTQSELLLAQERGMGTQLEQLYQQTRDFGLSVDETAKSLGVYTVATSTAKETTSSAKDLVKGLQEQYALLGLSARDAAIAKAQFAAMDKGATSGELAYIAETTAAIFDQNKASQALAQAKTQAAATTKKASEEAKAALDKWFNEGFSGAEKASQKLSEFHTKLESDLQRIRYEIDPTQEAFDQYNSKLNTLALAMQTGKITADEYHKAIYQLDSKQFDSPLSGMKDKGLDDLRELKQAIDGWGKDSARSIADFALSGKGSFSDFANSVIKDLMTMMIYQNMTKPLMTAAGSWMSSLFNGGMNWSSGNAVVAAQNASFNANGNAFTGVGIQAFANGGTFTNSIVNSPTAFKFANGGKFNLGVMGEAGPEAVMPLTRIGGKLGVLAQGGGGGHTNVIVNVMNSAGDAVQANARQSTNSNGDTVIDVMIDRVKGALLQDVGSNGQFSQAFSGAYGLSRRAF